MHIDQSTFRLINIIHSKSIWHGKPPCRVVSYRWKIANSLSRAVVRFSFSARFGAVHCPPSFLIAISIYNQCQNKYVQRQPCWLGVLSMIVIRIESKMHACVNLPAITITIQQRSLTQRCRCVFAQWENTQRVQIHTSSSYSCNQIYEIIPEKWKTEHKNARSKSFG